MPPQADERLFATTWVHVFEEDTAAGAVYRPEHGHIPLSRRPRERLALEPDGSARLFLPGPDDRFVPHPAVWSSEDGTVVVRAQSGDEVRIIDQSPERLVVRISRASRPR